MTQTKKLGVLRVALILYAILTLAYGIVYLFLPESYVASTGSEPIPAAWIRWIGGILIALGIAAIMIFRNPSKQGIFIFASAIGTLITGLTDLYSLFFESVGDPWASLAPAIAILVLSALLWIGLFQAKTILWNGEK